MKPRKPYAKKHVLVRCDGSKVTWREKWAWRIDHCEECGKPYAGTGEWYEASNRPAFHVGEFIRETTPLTLSLACGGAPGKWACCGEEFHGMMPGANAVIRDLQDPQEYADA